MSTELNRIQSRTHARDELKKLTVNASNSVVVHYSCESFFDTKDGKSPRITSIAVRNLDTAQSTSFSIHQYAEIEGIDNGDIDDNYEKIEKNMLHEYFEYMRTHQGLTWVHWNMRNINYGFAALEHRYKVLGGEPFVLEDAKKFDTACYMSCIYGRGYAENPRIMDLSDLNHFNKSYLLSGAKEAESFKKNEYLKLHQSTLSKVDVISHIIDLAASGSLKTRASFCDANGVHPKIIIEFIREHWIFGVLTIAAVLYAIARMLGITP